MQTIAEVMTRDVLALSPQDPASRAAALLQDMDAGSLPVCDGQQLVGMITERDLTARGHAPDETLVEDLMSADVLYCYDNQSVEEVLEDMGDTRIRHMPVLSHETEELVGLVALGELPAGDASDMDDSLGEMPPSSKPNPSSLH